MMTVLTTRQRDLLLQLIEADTSMTKAELADEMQLTSRQVSYDLKGARRWLQSQAVTLTNVSGGGVALELSQIEKTHLLDLLSNSANMQLVLMAGQRQQLLALLLLTADEPKILYQLQQLLQVSRTTILKDLDVVAEWLAEQQIPLERRQNYGFWIECSEFVRRQAIAMLLWGVDAFGPSIVEMNHKRGLVFPLGADADLLAAVEETADIIGSWDMRRTAGQVAYVEAQLGGRFTDDAVLYLALALAIQTQRAQAGLITAVSEENHHWLKSLPIWDVAARIAKLLGQSLHSSWPEDEVAYIVMHILATPRNERWPDDLEVDSAFSNVIPQIIAHIVAAYGMPNLAQDKTLRDGLVNHIVPACLRQRFDLWLPSFSQTTRLSEKYSFEYELALQIAEIVKQEVTVDLPSNEIDNIALLLRAAYIRERPNRLQEVLVVCPSGMASAQLLTARLKARFPRLGKIEVLSLREITQNRVDQTGLIISTVPLPGLIDTQGKMIQVHPLLLPEDVEAITEWLS